MAAQPFPTPDDAAASGPAVPRFGVGDEPWGANDYGLDLDTLLPQLRPPSANADEEVR